MMTLALRLVLASSYGLLGPQTSTGTCTALHSRRQCGRHVQAASAPLSPMVAYTTLASGEIVGERRPQFRPTDYVALKS